MNDKLKQELLEVLSRYRLCVVATVGGEARPESAIVGYSYNDDLELLFGTSEKTRKYANIQGNSHVSIVIGDFTAEIQYEGRVQELAVEEAEGRFERLPGTDEYRNDPSQRWLLVLPTWLRLTVHENPNRVEEVNLA